MGSLVGVGVEEAADDNVDLAADEQNQEQLLHLVRWWFSGKNTLLVRRKTYFFHDDNDCDGNNDQQNQQQLLHLVRWWFRGKKLGWLEEKNIFWAL